MDTSPSNVVSLAAVREEQTPHMQGPCICASCRHEWIGVCPVGVADLECSNCGAMKGRFKFHCRAPVGDEVYTCNTCECDVFVIKRGGEVMCCECGTYHRPWDCE